MAHVSRASAVSLANSFNTSASRQIALGATSPVHESSSEVSDSGSLPIWGIAIFQYKTGGKGEIRPQAARDKRNATQVSLPACRLDKLKLSL